MNYYLAPRNLTFYVGYRRENSYNERVLAAWPPPTSHLPLRLSTILSAARSMTRHVAIILAALLLGGLLLSPAEAQDGSTPAGRYHEKVQPILEQYCYGCHGYGSSEGDRTFDEFASDEAMLADTKLWWAVLKNVRSRMMPPAEEEQPTSAERDKIIRWIETDAFGINPADPDPGHVTLRRLNRAEYRNTIRDLMGVDYETEENFPPDDSGYGFDNIGDSLSLSPLLMEKYIQAAETIVDKAVPKLPKSCRFVASGATIKSDDGKQRARKFSFYEPAKLAGKIRIDNRPTIASSWKRGSMAIGSSTPVAVK